MVARPEDKSQGRAPDGAIGKTTKRIQPRRVAQDHVEGDVPAVAGDIPSVSRRQVLAWSLAGAGAAAGDPSTELSSDGSALASAVAGSAAGSGDTGGSGAMAR